MNAKTLGTLLRTRDGEILADLVDHETRLNPDGGGLNANPMDFVSSGSGYLITDAGANDVVRGASDSTTSTEYVLPVNQLPGGAAEACRLASSRTGTAPSTSPIWAVGTRAVPVSGRPSRASSPRCSSAASPT
ncbi:hypothetical protein NKH18_02140 [Streptomyces sp. M10(2022)]